MRASQLVAAVCAADATFAAAQSAVAGVRSPPAAKTVAQKSVEMPGTGVVVSQREPEAKEQLSVPQPPFLWEQDGGGPLEPVDWKQMKPKKNLSLLREGRLCEFDFDVVILQDVTTSFSSDIATMIESQLGLLEQGIRSTHPGSRFSVVTFMDKPIDPLGGEDDYCTSFDQPLTSNFTKVYEAYGHMESYGGADAPENQFGALYNVLTNPRIRWAKENIRLIVLVTDSGPHFAGDWRADMLPPFDPSLSDDSDLTTCTKQYYPSQSEVRKALVDGHAYLAQLVFDGDWDDYWALKSWQHFNRFIGQNDAFLAENRADSSTFWARLSEIVQLIEQIECPSRSTTTTTAVTSDGASTPTSPATTGPPFTTSGKGGSTSGDSTASGGITSSPKSETTLPNSETTLPECASTTLPECASTTLPECASTTLPECASTLPECSTTEPDCRPPEPRGAKGLQARAALLSMAECPCENCPWCKDVQLVLQDKDSAVIISADNKAAAVAAVKAAESVAAAFEQP